MSHKNYRRPVKFRKPTPMKPSRAITPDSIYDRNRSKNYLNKVIKEYK